MVVGFLGLRRVVPLEARAGMIVGVGFQAHALGQPLLRQRVVGVDVLGHQAQRRTAVDPLEPLENRADELFVLLRLHQVVDGKNNGRLDARFADPLGSGEPGGRQVRIIRIAGLIEICQAVAVGSRDGRPQGEHHDRKRKQT